MLSNWKSSIVFSKYKKTLAVWVYCSGKYCFIYQTGVTDFFLNDKSKYLRDLLKHLITKMETYKLRTCNCHHPQSSQNILFLFPVFIAENFRCYTQLTHPEYLLNFLPESIQGSKKPKCTLLYKESAVKKENV